MHFNLFTEIILVKRCNLFQYDQDCFEQGGRDLKAAFAFEYMAGFLTDVETAVEQADLGVVESMACHDNQLTALTSRIDVVQDELLCLRKEARIEVAKAEEEKDGRINERCLEFIYSLSSVMIVV